MSSFATTPPIRRKCEGFVSISEAEASVPGLTMSNSGLAFLGRRSSKSK
jgi:hypothetical protein